MSADTLFGEVIWVGWMTGAFSMIPSNLTIIPARSFSASPMLGGFGRDAMFGVVDLRHGHLIAACDR